MKCGHRVLWKEGWEVLRGMQTKLPKLGNKFGIDGEWRIRNKFSEIQDCHRLGR